MSAATARAARTQPRPAPRAPEHKRPDLRAVPPQPFRAPRGPFALVIGVVLTVGLLGVLLLNTVVAQDAFAVTALEQKAAELADKEQALTQQVAAPDSPQKLEERARRLGMVPSENPVFLRLADGKVLGKPVPGKKPVVKAPVKKKAVVPPPVDGAGAGTTPTALKTKAATPADQQPNALRTKAAQAREASR